VTIPTRIESLRVAGFRAYLQPQTFNLHRGKTTLSLAVFAPNAMGKSSLVDAFEFYFSNDATLARLGKRAAERNAGRGALEHVDAESQEVTPEVYFSFSKGGEKFAETRIVVPQGTVLPKAAERVLSDCALPFIVRGHQLRGFVETQTSEERYKEIAMWFGLDPLLEIQRNLRALRRQIKQDVESRTATEERLRDLARITNHHLKDWDESSIVDWLNNEIIAKLDKTLKLAAIENTDKGYLALKKRKECEDESFGLASLRRFLSQTDALHKEPTVDGEKSTGTIATFEKAVDGHASAVTKETDERNKASCTVFNNVWKAAKTVFDSKDIPLENCPVCDTDLSATPHGSREAIRIELDSKLNGLLAYQKAQQELASARTTLVQASQSVVQNLEALIASLSETAYRDRTGPLEVYKNAMTSWKTGEDAPDSSGAREELKALSSSISGEKQRIEEQQGESTYANALKAADDLIELKADLDRIADIKAELISIEKQLNNQALSINREIVEHTQNLIGKLRDDVNTLYKEMQRTDAEPPPIRLELPGAEEINQQRIQLLIDFSENRKGVVPTGYLSDSQIHTLALSLRLAAIRLFNWRVPIIVLDDVVTSYDVDNRKNIAAVLARHFGGFQIILVTHDERFFMLLQDHMPHCAWSYRRIIEIKTDFGPHFMDHRTPDETIQAKLDSNQSAANDIRQAEEEWLLDICRDFRVKVAMRPIDRPYKYDRSELAGGLASFLKKACISPPSVPGIANPFLASLERGDVENFGSHFSENPNETLSIGDEKTRWREFTFFRDLFVCQKCETRRFIRPDPLKKPICKKCEETFSFRNT